ncbi:LamB/YcsF family protein [Tolumonas auensis DSM 9187]|uniref:5-oxoprolinase subunit A n=1 Tax=Tolumonas auensis (strain DSM 9187 / NBRC 110442 / TA 4) TaxID=595494 RepID=PXPA_TOLAT|nr:5-oxoprolinase subunit PxpA [Tolumonas auensis]C4LFU8.1 RecName: Full=5-oxoprolinase subunit A; Short=5-OPase subunit A; AltName: Full=5-oxoprolinase (ATP-hydrolyzing) subunit A [Tolumonas auensis DSM 9187]ACQ93465.1 LamB/YcsF family protein [Tolumonas auensis DSM 9187]
MAQVDLNCDMGESFGIYQMGTDTQIMPLVSSANIACGFHAGDPSVMRKTLEAAVAQGVALGAHPGLPDLVGFGRRNMQVSAQEAYDMVVYQVGALAGFAKAAGVSLHHVKPHGALYNMAAKDKALADAIARAVRDIDASLVLYGLAGSQLIQAGKNAGLRVASEVFADRTYQADGSLTSRSQPNALLQSDEEAVQQVLTMVTEKRVKAVTGEWVSLDADTICIHGDGAHALSFATKVRAALLQAGVEIKAM